MNAEADLFRNGANLHRPGSSPATYTLEYTPESSLFYPTALALGLPTRAATPCRLPCGNTHALVLSSALICLDRFVLFRRACPESAPADPRARLPRAVSCRGGPWPAPRTWRRKRSRSQIPTLSERVNAGI